MQRLYDSLAETYDGGRSTQFSADDVWHRAFIERLRLDAGDLLLDAGCGTGQITIPVAVETRARSIGCDASAAMLSKALEKPGAERVRWLRGEIGSLPLRDALFQGVMASLVLHHLRDWRTGVLELVRVAGRSGRIVIRTLDHDAIRAHPIFNFFPEGMDVDLHRFPSVDEIVSLLKSRRCRVTRDVAVRPVSISTSQLLERSRAKYISTLALISERSYAEGCKRIEALVARDSDARFEYELRHTFITAVVS